MKTSKSGLFLLEMILVLLLFAVCGAICLQMFGYGTKTAENARNLSHGTLVARSAATCYQATGGDVAQMADVLEGVASDTTVTVHYQEDWAPTAQADTFAMTVTCQDHQAVIAVTQDDGAIYTLQVQMPGGAYGG